MYKIVRREEPKEGEEGGGGGSGSTDNEETMPPGEDIRTVNPKRQRILDKDAAGYLPPWVWYYRRKYPHEAVITVSRRLQKRRYFNHVCGPRTKIKEGAFKDDAASLEKVRSKDGVVVIPKAILEIGESAFENCTKVTKVCIPCTVKAIHDRAFAKCPNLTIVEFYPNPIADGSSLPSTDPFPHEILETAHLHDPSMRNTIEHKALGSAIFSMCTSLSYVALPEGCKTICSSTFGDCTSLTEVEFPRSLRHVRRGAFRGSNAMRTVTFLSNAIFVPPDRNRFVYCGAFNSCRYLERLRFGTERKVIPIPGWQVRKNDSIRRAVRRIMYNRQFFVFLACCERITQRCASRRSAGGEWREDQDENDEEEDMMDVMDESDGPGTKDSARRRVRTQLLSPSWTAIASVYAPGFRHLRMEIAKYAVYRCSALTMLEEYDPVTIQRIKDW